MQITYKICKVKDVYDKVLKNVTCKLRKVLSKSVKMSKEVGKVLKSVQNHHAETSNLLVTTQREPKP